MVVQYSDNNKFKALASILEDYTDWFAQFSLFLGYTDQENIPEDFTIPGSFTNWLDSDDIQDGISTTVLAPILDMHNAMKDLSVDMVADLQLGKKPSHKDFIELKNLYVSFLSSMRRLERDSALTADSVDDTTGLRSASAVKRDLNREMQRLARNGNPFALVLARIDAFDKVHSQKEALSLAVDNIKKSMRPFDDAYYLENGQFLLSLKHADMVGAEVAITRIQQSLNLDEKNTNDITLSCCMSEPVNGDEISELLKNMKDDLNAHQDDVSTVLKFLDISPLERFVESRK